MSGITEQSVKSARRHLALATISFTLCFAAWGLISALALVFALLARNARSRHKPRGSAPCSQS